MWFATERGLHRYDGYRFIVHRHEKNNPRSISGDDVNVLYFDSKDRFWVGTVSEGLNLFDRTTSTFRRFRHNSRDPHSLSSDSITCVYEDKKGRIWVGTWTGGLNLLDPATGRCEQYQPIRDVPSDREPIQRSVTSMLQDRSGTFWVTSWNGLNKFEPETGRFHFLPNRKFNGMRKDSITSRYIYTVYEAGDGGIWIGTYEGLNWYHPKTRQLGIHVYDASFIGHPAANAVRCIMEGPDGRIWCGSEEGGGIQMFDPVTRRTERMVHDMRDPFSLSDNRVRQMYRDSFGCYWIATLGGGVDFYNPKVMNFNLYQPEIGAGKHHGVRAMKLDSKGTFWVSYHMGFGTFDLVTKSFSWHPFSDRLFCWRGPS
ncbi:MAG: hypothetical protein IH628_11775, partial [Proteobacteria bacterium]|nr:hypothetical protein [Pseudomonadota bacterium]